MMDTMTPTEMTALCQTRRFPLEKRRPMNISVEKVLCHSPTLPFFVIGQLSDQRYLVMWGDYAHFYDSLEAMQEVLNVHEKTLLLYSVGAAA
jgi:hypothetical protein